MSRGESQPQELIIDDADVKVDPTPHPHAMKITFRLMKRTARIIGVFKELIRPILSSGVSGQASAAVHSPLLSLSLTTVPSAHLSSKPLGLVYHVMALSTPPEV